MLPDSESDVSIVKTIAINALLSVAAGYTATSIMKQYMPIFIQRGLYGTDMCKKDKKPVPEPMGVVAAAVYLIFMFIFIPVPFVLWINHEHDFPYVRLLSLLGAMISTCTAILLGFADDMLDLRWRHKLLFPTLSSLPLLMIYHIGGQSTSVLLPGFLRGALGTTYVNIGPLFYLYMGMLVIFCTNAINIIAGINGVEAGQSIVIAASVAVFNVVQIFRIDDAESDWNNTLSLCILLPFLGTTIALYLLNRYPAQVFVGDTFCYWAGMLLAVVGILGHFSKTLLLFCVPQVFNFLYSIPQLFHLVPCPRHRLPRFDGDGDGKLHMSVSEFDPDRLPALGTLILRVFRLVGIVDYSEHEKDGARMAVVNNLTILNLILKFTGPLYEYQLNAAFLALQVGCSVVAFVCRFYLAYLLYDQVL